MSDPSKTDWDEMTINAFKCLFPNGGIGDVVFAEIVSILPQVKRFPVLLICIYTDPYFGRVS
jgi:hypothetical protein